MNNRNTNRGVATQVSRPATTPTGPVPRLTFHVSRFTFHASPPVPLQDLTPQLRTRLSRLERLVGWFVTIATLLLLLGLGYYVYQLARNRGWFLTKMPYFTFVNNAAGLNVGDRVRLMGFEAGEITHITAQPPEASEYGNVYVQFRVREPY